LRKKKISCISRKKGGVKTDVGTVETAYFQGGESGERKSSPLPGGERKRKREVSARKGILPQRKREYSPGGRSRY